MRSQLEKRSVSAMKNVLIVDDEATLIDTIEKYCLAYKDQFSVLTALNGKAAVKILESTKIDLVVTDLRMPEMGGIELLTYINKNFFYIPTVVMSRFGTPEIQEELDKAGSPKFLEKPFDIKDLVNAIFIGLDQGSEHGHVKNISVSSFLQLIEMEEKTCLLEVTGGEKRKGYFFIHRGMLYDASYGALNGQDAAVLMMTWNNAQIYLKELPQKNLQRRINKGLVQLLMESAVLKDKAGFEEKEGAKKMREEIVPSAPAVPETDNTGLSGITEKIREHSGFKGFIGAGLFDFCGNPVAVHPQGEFDLDEAGPVAVAALNESHKALERLNAEAGSMIYLQAEKGHMFIACLNESGFVNKPEHEETFFHFLFIASPQVNIGLLKKKFEAVAYGVIGVLKKSS